MKRFQFVAAIYKAAMGKSSVRYRKTTFVVATEVAVIGCTMFQNSRNSTVHSGACLPVAERLLGTGGGRELF